ncbi:hypothetical protein ATN88_12055 [Enterovibrio coralii]|uniref:Uncharacterized protein n=1 Tax=Enterovibrio coralii TaxID=294935 RepID=A0A135I3E9_9GAMM|nr:hypothetical protein ATN88_12055 [Enterovibrio coralii]
MQFTLSIHVHYVAAILIIRTRHSGIDRHTIQRMKGPADVSFKNQPNPNIYKEIQLFLQHPKKMFRYCKFNP